MSWLIIIWSIFLYLFCFFLAAQHPQASVLFLLYTIWRNVSMPLKIRAYLWGEWPSGLRRCDWNRKVPGSNPTRHSAGLRDLTSLQCSSWPSGWIYKTQMITLAEWGYLLDNVPKLAVESSVDIEVIRTVFNFIFILWKKF